jgi:hypothetical protein
VTSSSKRRSPEVQEAIALQKRANTIVMAALKDEQFMSGVMEACQLEDDGNKGDLLTDVIKHLGIV